MSSISKSARKQQARSNPIFVESLESRTYFDLVPTIPGAVPTSLIATVKTKDAITVDLTNSGGASIKGAYTLELLVSPDGLIGDATPIVTLNKNLLPLGAGKTRAFRIPLGSLPLVANGGYNILAEVTGSLAGSGDNVGVSAGQVTVADPFVDLTDTITLNGRTSLDPKASFNFSVTVFNAGNVAAKGPVQIQIGSSTNSNGSASTTKATPTKMINIAPGKHMVFHFSSKIPEGTIPGTYFAVATVDPLDTFNESNTGNNFAVTPTALTVLDPFANIVGSFTGPFDDTKGVGRGVKGTLTLDIATESNTNGALTGTGTNSLGASFTFVGDITTAGVFTIDTDDAGAGITSVLAGHFARGKFTGTFHNSDGNSGTFSAV